MNTFGKIATLIVATGMVTTLVMPKHQTSKVLDSLFKGVSRWQGTAMGLRTG